MHVDPSGCSLPFQFTKKQFYGCLQTNSTPQCGGANDGQLVDCIAPAGEWLQYLLYSRRMLENKISLNVENNTLYDFEIVKIRNSEGKDL